MRCSLLLIAPFLPSLAAAGNLADWLSLGATGTDIAGTVEVPLVRAPNDGRPLVRWTGSAPEAGDDDKPAKPAPSGWAVVGLALGTTIDKPTAKALGATMRHRAGAEVATIPELHIGDLVLHGLRAKVVTDEPGIILGVAALDQTGVAILPSEGLVRFVPTTEAAAMVAGLGTPVTFRGQSDKPYWFHGSKVTDDGTWVTVPGSVAGREASIRMSPASVRTDVADGVELTDSARRSGVAYGQVALSIGGQALPDHPVALDQQIRDRQGQVRASVAYDHLYSLDIGVDPAGGTLSLRPATAVKWTRPEATELEAARLDFESGASDDSDAEDEASDGSDTGPDKGDAAAVSRLTAWGDALWNAGQSDAGLDQFRAAADAAGDNCAPYHLIGNRLIARGRAADAREFLEKAGTLYDSWASQPLPLRAEIEAKGDKGTWPDGTWTLIEPASCYTAWGDLARAQLALGDFEALAKNYADHLDLDPLLPTMYGVALLALGKADEANGPLRQAINQGDRTDVNTRTALALAYSRMGNNDMLLAQVDRMASQKTMPDVDVLLPLIHQARMRGGAELAHAVASRFVAADPLSPATRLAWAMQAQNDGDEAELELAMDGLEAMVQSEWIRSAGSSESAGHRAIHAVLDGDLKGARAVIDGYPGIIGSAFRTAKVVLETAEGDPEAAYATLRAIAQKNPGGIASTYTFMD